jgi:hypothetical protein
VKGAAARLEGDLEGRIQEHPAPKYYDGPVRLLARRPEATKPVVSPPPAEGAQASAP